MKTTCLINSFNYREYVSEAVDSALAQSVQPGQIVVVDDGSTDGSVEHLESRYRDDPRVEIVSKSNGGQLSCFETGVARATGDIVFFLDADDMWLPGYLESVIDFYASRPAADFVFCGLRCFGRENNEVLKWKTDRDLGYSAAAAHHQFRWIGAPTSALSMRRWVVERIFPIPFHDDWRIRADDCLVFGASLVGANKHYMARALVRYRVHDRNRFYGQPWDARRKYQRRLAVGRLVDMLTERMGWSAQRLADVAHLEFATIKDPSLKEFRRYTRVSTKARRGFVIWLKRLVRMIMVMNLNRSAAQVRAARTKWANHLGIDAVGSVRSLRDLAIEP